MRQVAARNTTGQPRSRRLLRGLLVAAIAIGLLVFVAARSEQPQSPGMEAPGSWTSTRVPVGARIRGMPGGLLLLIRQEDGMVMQGVDWSGNVLNSLTGLNADALVDSIGDTYALWDPVAGEAIVGRWPADELYRYTSAPEGVRVVSLSVDGSGRVLLAGVLDDEAFAVVTDSGGHVVNSYNPGQELPLVARFLAGSDLIVLITLDPGPEPTYRLTAVDPGGDVQWRTQVRGVPRSVSVCPIGGYAGLVTADEIVVVSATGTVWTGEPPAANVCDAMVTPDGRIILLYEDEGETVAVEMRRGGSYGWEAIVGGRPGALGLLGDDIVVITSTAIFGLTRQGSPLWDAELPPDSTDGADEVLAAGSAGCGVYVMLDTGVLVLFARSGCVRGSDTH